MQLTAHRMNSKVSQESLTIVCTKAQYFGLKFCYFHKFCIAYFENYLVNYESRNT